MLVQIIRKKGIDKSVDQMFGRAIKVGMFWSFCGEWGVVLLGCFDGLFLFRRFDLDDMIRFTLTVRKNYRNVPYHNWAHAFSVAHAMFTVIKTSQHRFTPIEVGSYHRGRFLS